MKYYIGIDPGKKGGVAIITDEGLLVESYEMPLTPSKELDIVSIFFNLTHKRLSDDLICGIEKSQSMPKQGVKSMFSYGVGYGQLIAMLKIAAIPFQEIPPNKWKKEFSLTKKSKADSCDVANNLFPTESFMTDRGRIMDGKAEALLLAEYIRRKSR